MMLAACVDTPFRRSGTDLSASPPSQRFVPVSSVPQATGSALLSGAFALDTATGQLCYTYREAGSKTLSIPLCRDLLEKK